MLASVWPLASLAMALDVDMTLDVVSYEFSWFRVAGRGEADSGEYWSQMRGELSPDRL
jgi:hypothetical protein